MAAATLVLALAACERAGVTEVTAAAEAEPPPGDLAPSDLEVPEVFAVTGPGLWDGRPSLGGVWVAHPDVQEPDRVVVRNEGTGASVTGALFRRERESPGPAIQVSSEAAAALGMLAGAPASLEVVALRRAEPDVTTSDAPSPDAPTSGGATPAAPEDGAAIVSDAGPPSDPDDPGNPEDAP